MDSMDSMVRKDDDESKWTQLLPANREEDAGSQGTQAAKTVEVEEVSRTVT